MGRWIKRLLVLLIIGGSSTAAYRVLKRRGNREWSGSQTPEWPPFEPPSPTDEIAPFSSSGAVTAAATVAADAPDWLPPIDGACPPGYLIKANDNSHIYHVAGGRFYDRTVAERCYSTEATAERDGYRRAKS